MAIKKPTINDIAREAGVSISTVSRVINKSLPVAEDTTRRVEDTIQRLDFKPNLAARNLASKHTNTIGLLLPFISGGFFSMMLAGINRCISQSGFDLLIFASPKLERHEFNRALPVGEHNTDGLLVFTSSLVDEDIIRMHRHGFPLVLMHRSAPEGLPIPAVTFENKKGTTKLIDHLIEAHHCHKIAFLSGPPFNEDSYWREQGLRASLANHGLEIDPGLMGVGEFDGQIAAAAVRNMLNNGARPDAIFTGDDESAAGVITALIEMGIRVPEDMAVVGFDDEVMAPYLQVPLTTVRAPTEAAGYEAARQLINLIHTGAADLFTILPTELVVRRSCGCNL
jgi:LacI family transcriptional regulator